MLKMLKLEPKENGLFVIRTVKKKARYQPIPESGSNTEETQVLDDSAFIAKLKYSNRLISKGQNAKASLLHLDILNDMLELLDTDDDVVALLDYDDENTYAAMELVAMAAKDHFRTCNFEMAMGIGKFVFDFDNADHFDVLPIVLYSCAALGDVESVDVLLGLLEVGPLERELATSLALLQSGHSISFSNELRKELQNEESNLAKMTSHIWSAINKL